MNKFELIDAMIRNLDGLTVQGTRNMQIVLVTIQNLNVLREGLAREEEAKNPKEEEKPAE